MKLVSLIIVFFHISLTVAAQWTDLTSKRNDIVFVNEVTGWMVGAEGSLLNTTDGGKTWINQKSPCDYIHEEITKIAAFDGGSSLKVVTRRPDLSALYSSSDGGENWKRVAFKSQFNFDMHFISASEGWYWVIPEGSSDEAVFHTTDGGNTWTEVPELNAIMELTSNGSNVWAIQQAYGFEGIFHILWTSKDGGTSWTSSEIGNVDFADYTMPELQFFDSQNGWLCTKVDKAIYKTTDGGATWERIADPLFSKTFLVEMYFLEQSIGFVSGLDHSTDSQVIYKTADGGQHWTIVNSVDYPFSFGSDEIRVIYFWDAETGFAAGEKGLYMETKDGGNTWETKNRCTIGSNYPVNDIAFNGSDVWVVGENLVQTSSDGVAWSVYDNLLESVHYEESAISFRGDGKGIMVSDLRYKRTSDNGLTWNSFSPTFEYSDDYYNNHMWHDPKGNVWIQKANATLFKSEDNGQNFKISWKPEWLEILGSDRQLEFQTDKKIWYYGEAKLMRSNDGGLTWTRTYETIKRLQFISEDIGFKLSGEKKLYKTIDGGETWTLLSSILHWSPFDYMFFADETVGWVGSKLGIILKTIDGGQTWTNENTGMLNDYFDMAFSKNNEGKIIGYLGGRGLLRLTTDYVPQPVIDLGDVVLSVVSSGEDFVNLEWTDNSTLEDGFFVQRKLPGGTFMTIATTTSTSFNDTSIEPGKTYTYRVAIYKTGRATHYSNEVKRPPAPQQITFLEISDKVYGDPAFPLVAHNSSGLPMEFSISDESIASIEGNIVTIHGVGETTITVSSAGNADFLPAQVSRTLHVKKADQQIIFAAIDDQIIGSEDIILNASTSSGLAVEFSSTSVHIRVAENTVSLLSPGRATITASQVGNDQYNSAVEEQTFCINPAKPIIISDIADILTSSGAMGNQWYRNGELMANETSASISLQESGTYTVTTTVEGCTSQHSEAFDALITGMADEVVQGANLYPNPATDKVVIDLSRINQQKPIEIQIYDTTGKRMLQLTVNGKSEIEIDIHRFSKGEYILKATGGGNYLRARFVKR